MAADPASTFVSRSDVSSPYLIKVPSAPGSYGALRTVLMSVTKKKKRKKNRDVIVHTRSHLCTGSATGGLTALL